jgi:anti-anti-sigma regulatory factor
MIAEAAESRHQLTGDWTIAGVMNQMDSLSQYLHELAATCKKHVHIDCERIDVIDMSGLQLLHVWIECIRMRGMEAQLLNMPDSMRQSIQRLGLGNYFMDNCQAAKSVSL